MRFAKVLVLGLLAAAVLSTAASAQTGYVACYFDNGLSVEQSNCPGAPAGTVADTLYIAMVNWNAFVSGIQFKVDYPAQMLWLGDNGLPATAFGNTASGLAVAWGVPQNGYLPALICTSTFVWNCSGCSSTDIPLTVVGHPLLGGTITATIWPDNHKQDGIGLTGRICPTVPVENTTWGQVKSLYGD